MLYALLAIAVLVLLVTWLKLNPFIALLISSLTLGAMVVATSGTLAMTEILEAFQTGFGRTLAGTGSIIVLGVVFGKLLAESGGAGVLAKQFIRTLGPSRIGLCIILLALCVGMTTWFAVGLLLILPIVITLAKETGKPFLLLVLPLLSFLSVMHGLMPPHPGPVIAIKELNASMGMVILWALVLGIPVAAIAGPFFARLAVRRVDVATPEFTPSVSAGQTLPTFGLTIFTVLLPVILLLSGTVVEVLAKSQGAQEYFKQHGLTPPELSLWGKVGLFVGHPVIALLLSVLFAMWAFGKRCGRSLGELLKFSEQSVSGIGMTLILVGAGGGFALVMRTAGVDKQLAELAASAGLPLLVYGWLVSAFIRVATGSATVAITVASGFIAPVLAAHPGTSPELMVISIGCGSLFLSHLNDSGFWMVKECLGLSVGQTLRTWTITETLIGFSGLGMALLAEQVLKFIG
jgi:gluconate:H+ symporter, GntP family